MAIKNRSVKKELLFHCFTYSSKALGSDRGIQYASMNFTNVIESNRMITRSRSRKGNFWNNAMTESFLDFENRTNL
jgi:putative transposase